MSRLVSAALCCSLLVSSAARSEPTTKGVNTPDCAADEKQVFGCGLEANDKSVVLCQKGEVLFYRFGASGKLELQFPKTSAPARTGFKRSINNGPHYVEAGIWFSTGAFVYQLSFYSHLQMQRQAAQIDVFRKKGAKKAKHVATLRCDESSIDGDLQGLVGVIPDGEEAVFDPAYFAKLSDAE